MYKKRILKELVLFTKKIGQIEKELKKHESEEPILFFLKKDHIINAITKLNKKEIAPQELVKWASLIELRDDIEFDLEWTQEAIHRLSTPELYSEQQNIQEVIEGIYCLNFEEYFPIQDKITRKLDKIGWRKLCNIYEKAIKFYEKALENREKKGHSCKHIEVIYHNLGYAYFKTQQYRKSLLFYEKALEIYQNKIIFQLLDLGMLYIHIGDLYQKINNTKDALIYYQKALPIYEKELPKKHLALGELYYKSAAILFLDKSYKKAIIFYNQVLSIYRYNYGWFSAQLAAAYCDLASAEEADNKKKAAFQSYQNALTIIYTKLPKINNSIILKIQESIKKLTYVNA